MHPEGRTLWRTPTIADEDFQTPADVSQAFGRLPDEVAGAGPARQARASMASTGALRTKYPGNVPTAHSATPDTTKRRATPAATNS